MFTHYICLQQFSSELQSDLMQIQVKKGVKWDFFPVEWRVFEFEMVQYKKGALAVWVGSV